MRWLAAVAGWLGWYAGRCVCEKVLPPVERRYGSLYEGRLPKELPPPSRLANASCMPENSSAATSTEFSANPRIFFIRPSSLKLVAGVIGEALANYNSPISAPDFSTRVTCHDQPVRRQRPTHQRAHRCRVDASPHISRPSSPPSLRPGPAPFRPPPLRRRNHEDQTVHHHPSGESQLRRPVRRPALRGRRELGLVCGRLVQRRRRHRGARLDQRTRTESRGPASLQGSTFPNCPDTGFQFHHQPFNYFADFGTQTKSGLKNRKKHLRDEIEFIKLAQTSKKECKLKSVSFVKPIGEGNEHPGHSSEPVGSDHGPHDDSGKTLPADSTRRAGYAGQ
ncbi:protein of unknown function [Methylococcus capsulatus]|uniref:Uncharacterized protein n=1 Tax=Methylococcus capsulatus TaxID=414 RepID=A0AA35XYL0_METCP|nr:protein of unknown function [Methylococcus capsulatus]